MRGDLFKLLIEEFKKSKAAQDIQKAFPDVQLVDLTEEE